MHAEDPRGSRAGLEGGRVLVVEDSAVVAMLIEDELLGAGAEVVGPAATVGDALLAIDSAMRNGGLDGALVDIDLAGVSAGPVADRLAALGVPFLFASGYDHAHPGMAGHEAAPVLDKPFDPQQLVDMLAAFLLSTTRTRTTRDGSPPPPP